MPVCRPIIPFQTRYWHDAWLDSMPLATRTRFDGEIGALLTSCQPGRHVRRRGDPDLFRRRARSGFFET